MALALISAFTIVPNASAVTIQLGDSNQDGTISVGDVSWIYYYINGSITANAYQLAAMDVNQDGIIDKSDAIDAFYKINNYESFETTNKLYSVIDNDALDYLKHDCSSTNPKQSDEYRLYRAGYTPFNYTSYVEPVEGDNLDKENIGCVKLTYDVNGNDKNLGSAFVVDDHIVATAAHCVYNSNNNEFVSGIKVKVLNDNCSKPLVTAKARYIHIPKDYTESNSGTPKRVNHDYALIYVEEDLSDYKVNVGVMTNYFMTTEQNLTTSGFTAYDEGNQRYFSEGPVATMDHLPYEKAYRYRSFGICAGGKSGGMTYFKSLFPYNDPDEGNEKVYRELKSVVGINTSSSGQDTYGCRMTTTLLRFYFQNDNLC